MTGLTAAGSVLGRAAMIQAWRGEMVGMNVDIMRGILSAADTLTFDNLLLTLPIGDAVFSVRLAILPEFA